MSDEDSEQLWHGNGAVKPIADDHNAPVTTTSGDVVASMPSDNKPSVMSSVKPSTTTIKESATQESAVASTMFPAKPKVIDLRVEVSDLGFVEHKAQQATLDLGPSVSQARHLVGCYASGGVPPMPPPSEWPTLDGSGAALIAIATIYVHIYYGVFPKWKSEGKILGRICPITVVLFPNETTDQYEAAFLRRSKPHAYAVRQRSQRLNFVLNLLRMLTGGNVPLNYCATSLALVQLDLAGLLELVCLLVSINQPRHVDAQYVNLFPRVKTLGVSFPLDKNMKLLLL